MKNTMQRLNNNPQQQKAPTASTSDDDHDTSKLINKTLLQHIPYPPWHSVCVVVTIVATCMMTLPSTEDFDHYAMQQWMDHHQSILFRYITSSSSNDTDISLLSSIIRYYTIVTYIRMIFAGWIWTICLYLIIFEKDGTSIHPPYLPGSQLQSTIITLKGIRTMYPFTSWCWILLGFCFTSSSYLTYQTRDIYQTSSSTMTHHPDDMKNIFKTTISPYILRTCMFFWETSAPFALLVAAIVKFVIWPRVLQETNDTSNLRHFTTLCMHNMNVLFVIIEVCYLSNLSVRYQDISFAPIIGCMYVLFSWSMCTSWISMQEYGPQFIYFFLDTTIPGYTPTIAIIGLLCVLMMSYTFFVLVSYILLFFHGSIVYHTIVAIFVCRLVMRFRD